MAFPESPGRRHMSYRKPPPKYIPSPPPSPLSSPISPFNRITLSPRSPTPDETPPLPDDWREVIRLAMAANASSRSFATSAVGAADIAIPLSTSVLDVSQKDEVFPITTIEDRNYSRVSLFQVPDENPARSPTPGKSRKPHRNYRPPTPPLQAHYKQRRLPDDDSGLLSPIMPCRMIYPDIPWVHNSQDAYQTSSMPTFTMGGDSFSTLTTNRIPSFNTEKSHCLNATTDSEASTTWPGALSTFNSDTDPSLNLPVYRAGKLVIHGGADVEEKPSELHHFWRRAGTWVRTRLRSFSPPASFC